MWSRVDGDILHNHVLRGGHFLMRRRNTPYTNKTGNGYKNSTHYHLLSRPDETMANAGQTCTHR